MWVLFGAVLIILSFSFFVSMKIRARKYKNTPNGKTLRKIKVKDEEGNIKEQEVEEENQSKINTNQIKISIWKKISPTLYAQAGKEFYAFERTDNNTNTIVINEEKMFKEDFNFSIDRVYEILKYDLKLMNKNKAEKLNILNAKIKKQQELLDKINSDVDLNENHNFNDEELKLNQLKVYHNHIKYESNGNYMRLATGGVRYYELVAIDGYLMPFFYGADYHRASPDTTTKKKIFNQENTIFKMEQSALDKNLPLASLITLGVGLILAVAGVGGLWFGFSKNTEITQQANQGAITCADTLSYITQNYGSMVTEYIDIKRIEQKESEKDTSNINNQNNNNNIGLGDIININPNK